MNAHTEHCRDSCVSGEDTDQMLHQILERLDRITRAVELVVSIGAPLLKSRLAKFAGARAVAKVQAEWKSTDERD